MVVKTLCVEYLLIFKISVQDLMNSLTADCITQMQNYRKSLSWLGNWGNSEIIANIYGAEPLNGFSMSAVPVPTVFPLIEARYVLLRDTLSWLSVNYQNTPSIYPTNVNGLDLTTLPALPSSVGTNEVYLTTITSTMTSSPINTLIAVYPLEQETMMDSLARDGSYGALIVASAINSFASMFKALTKDVQQIYINDARLYHGSTAQYLSDAIDFANNNTMVFHMGSMVNVSTLLAKGGLMPKIPLSVFENFSTPHLQNGYSPYPDIGACDIALATNSELSITQIPTNVIIVSSNGTNQVVRFRIGTFATLYIYGTFDAYKGHSPGVTPTMIGVMQTRSIQPLSINLNISSPGNDPIGIILAPINDALGIALGTFEASVQTTLLTIASVKLDVFTLPNVPAFAIDVPNFSTYVNELTNSIESVTLSGIDTLIADGMSALQKFRTDVLSYNPNSEVQKLVDLINGGLSVYFDLITAGVKEWSNTILNMAKNIKPTVRPTFNNAIFTKTTKKIKKIAIPSSNAVLKSNISPTPQIAMVLTDLLDSTSLFAFGFMILIIGSIFMKFM